MNYRHAYHAGNHADVFKHLVLARIFALLGRKDTPYAYLDSHSGVGLYDLQGDEASRTGEWEQGIARLWEREGLPEQLDDYLDVIRHLNPDGSLRYYPSSRRCRCTKPSMPRPGSPRAWACASNAWTAASWNAGCARRSSSKPWHCSGRGSRRCCARRA